MYTILKYYIKYILKLYNLRYQISFTNNKRIIDKDSIILCFFKGSHGLYWDLGSDFTLSANNILPAKFSFELLPNNRMLIKGPNGCYLKGEQSGGLTSNIQDPKLATQWEF
jgi:hypothetical protein